MSRRRLRVVHDSSSEDEENSRPPPPPIQQQLQFDDEDDIEVELQESTTNLQSVTLNPPNPNPNPTPSVSVQIDISDDDFIDVPEDFSTPSPPPPPPPPPAPHQQSFQFSNTSTVTNSNSFEASDSPVSRFLENMGLRLRREWLDPCILELENSLPEFRSMGVAAKAKLCFGQFLYSDMNHSGAGVLPDNVHSMHSVDLPGPFILQVDEIVNITCPLKGRYYDKDNPNPPAPPGPKRCLKLCMTDGVQRVFGMEYRPIKDLEVIAPAGLKVAICNVNIRRGLLMLVPQVLEVLGGEVENLEAARKRLMKEVNKPPRGKRTRNGAIPPLATRATLAAWPPDSPNGPGQTNNSFAQAATPLPNVAAGPSYHVNAPRNSSIPSSPRAAPVPNIPARPPGCVSTPGYNSSFVIPPTVLRPDSKNVPGQTSFAQAAPPLPNVATGPSYHVNALRNSSIPSSQWAAPAHNIPACPPSRVSAPGQNSSPITPPTVPRFNETSYPLDRVNAPRHTSSPILETTVPLPNVAACPPDHVNTPRHNGNPLSGFEAPLRTGQAGISTTGSHIEDLTIPSRNELNPSSASLSDIEEIHMIDEVELPFVPSADEETPFTYLASLSAKWAAAQDKSNKVQGKIKCFLTGVKGFQYKRRDTFELRAYVDDGSLISEILIDHNVVQRGIGHSPRQVTAGLTSSDSRVVGDMKEKLKQFQLYLANFEGTMLVQMSDSSALPVVVEMDQGCPQSDAWLLLTRMQLREPARPQQDHIRISP